MNDKQYTQLLQKTARAYNHYREGLVRAQCKPRIAYDPGCEFITCEHEDCRCAMNNGDGEPTTAFLAKWERMHGKVSK